MSETAQGLVVLVIVAVAVVYVWRRVRRRQRGQSPACGHCSACDSRRPPSSR
jgi:membrane protein implicated in regulation of membrane protease activity